MNDEPSSLELQTRQQAAEHARVILDQMYQFAGLLDLEGHLLEANRAALDAAGVSREQVIGRLFWETPWWSVSSEVQERLKNAIRRAAQGEFVRFEVPHHVEARSRELITVDFSLKPILDDSGRVLYLLPEGRDITDKKKAESYTLLRAVTEGTTDAIFVKDTQGRYLMINTAGALLLGKSVPEVVGKTDFDLFTPESAERIRQVDQKIMAEGQPQTHEEVITSAGVTRTYLVTKGPYRDEQGQTIGLWGISRDVTERKLADEALRFSEAKYRQIVETASEGIWVVDADGKTTFANQHMLELLGYTLEELLGQHPINFVAPESIAEVRRSFADIQRGVRTFGELALLCKDGSTIWVILSNNVIYDPQGRYAGALGMFTDITERKRIEAQIMRLNQDLQRKVSELQALLDIVPIGIAVAEDAQCHVMHGNRTFTQMLGVAPDANLSKSHPASRGVLHHRYIRDGRELKPDELPMQLAGATGAPVANVTFDLVREDGKVLKLIGNAAPLLDQQGRPAGVVGAFWDIEYFRRTEERLRTEKEFAESASIAKDRFLAMLSHELRNPLSTILNALQVTEEADACRDCPVREHRAIIARQTRHLARLVDDLLDVSRITAGKISLKKQAVDLTLVVRNCAQACQPAIQERRQEITLSLPSQPLLVQGDPARLEQIVMNLLSNAMKYSAPGGHIWITATVANSEAILRVRDNGIGIPAEALPRLFEAFMQVDDSLDRSQGGLGLGLTLVRSLVQMHGGTVAASSEGLGHGSEFAIHLPQLLSAPPCAPEPQKAPRKAASHRILLVEDQPDARRVLRRLLELWGHTVDVAENGPEAVDKALALRPEVALVDIGLPGFNGLEVARRVRDALGSSVFLIALTGYGQPEDIQQAEEAGFDLHLVKPVEPTRLAQLLGEVRIGPAPS